MSVFEPTPYIVSHSLLHTKQIRTLLELEDGSIVSCSLDGTAKRWLLLSKKSPNNSSSNDTKTANNTTDDGSVQLLGVYEGHSGAVWGVVEKDYDTIITGGEGGLLKVWDKTTCRCLETVDLNTPNIYCLLKTKDNSRLICSLSDGWVEVRQLSDLALINIFEIYSASSTAVHPICELVDEGGSVVFVGSGDGKLLRWDSTGKLTGTFSSAGPMHSWIEGLIESKRGTVVSASGGCLEIWRVVTGECLLSKEINAGRLVGLEKVKDGIVVCAYLPFYSWRGPKIRVWDDKGNNIQSIDTDYQIQAMTRLRDGSLVTASEKRLEIRQL